LELLLDGIRKLNTTFASRSRAGENEKGGGSPFSSTVRTKKLLKKNRILENLIQRLPADRVPEKI
jgi:hypothetical protein